MLKKQPKRVVRRVVRKHHAEKAEQPEVAERAARRAASKGAPPLIPHDFIPAKFKLGEVVKTGKNALPLRIVCALLVRKDAPAAEHAKGTVYEGDVVGAEGDGRFLRRTQQFRECDIIERVKA